MINRTLLFLFRPHQSRAVSNLIHSAIFGNSSASVATLRNCYSNIRLTSAPMAPHIKLTYFKDCRARIEITRLVLKYAKVPFEEYLFEVEEWPQLKPKTVLGISPEITIDGKTYIQGLAMATYLAREYGLYGATNMDCFMIDQIQQVREDLLIVEVQLHIDPEESRPAIDKKLTEEMYPKTLKYYNDIIKNNPTKSGFAVGDKLTLADIAIFEGFETYSQRFPSGLDSYPEVKALRAKVAEVDGIKQYLAERGEMPM